jgi:inner membrane protein
MEPVEHFLFGAALSRAGFNRWTGYATVVMVLAAEAPDLDVLYGIGGPVAGFAHHRGWTHTLIATPVVAAITVAVVWAMSRMWRRPQKIPVHWGRLFLLGWLAALSHIALDWTNNYGVRPFWPFSPKWYEGDLVFILEPVMLGVLALAMIVPGLLGLADREIGAKRVTFRGQKWAWFALAVTFAMWTVRAVEHQRALTLIGQREWEAGEPRRTGLGPFPVTPFTWHAVVDTGDKYQTAYVDTWTGQVRTNPQTGIFYKPPVTPTIRAAEASWLGRVYMDWSSWPLVTAQQPEVDSEDESSSRAGMITPVEFEDLRFAYEIFGRSMGSGGKTPLGAEVLVGPDGSVLQMKMGDRVQK